MRFRNRAVSLLALALAAITCTDAPTSPGRPLKPSTLRMAPSFSADAAAAFSSLAAFGIEVTEVRVRLTAPDGTTRDTVIAFPPGQDQLVIEIPVQGSLTDQPFNVVIELRNDLHEVLFSGTQTVIARSANLPAAPPPVITIQYTGPGRDVRTVAVLPGDTTAGATASIPYRATAVSTAGAPISDLLVRWTSSDPTLATVTQNSNNTATVTGTGRRGVVTLTATTPQGIVGTGRLSLVPGAARVVVVAGGGQTGVAGSTLAQPFVVEVQATDNLPVPGAQVAFRAITSGGSVQTATAVADATGRASTSLRLGNAAGPYQFEATSGALAPVVISASATPAPAAAIAALSGNGQADTAGKTLGAPLVVRVTDQFGGTVSGATVSFVRTGGSGSVGSASAITGVDGTASTSYTLGNTVGSDTVRATVTGVTGSAGTVDFVVRTLSRPPATIAITQGGGQTGTAGSTLPSALVARVLDVQGNPVAGATVVWSVPLFRVAFNPASTVTSGVGQAGTSVTLGNTAGVVTVTASVGTLSTTAQLTIVAGSTSSLTKVGGDGQSAVAGATVAVPPSVVVRDALANPVAGVTVTFAVTSGGGSVTGATPTTDASGVATVGSWRLGATAGANSLTATAGALSATFTATAVAGSASKLLVVQGAPASITVGAAIPGIKLQLADASNNVITQAGVTLTLSGIVTPSSASPALAPNEQSTSLQTPASSFSASATTDANGVATFTISPYIGVIGTAVITVTGTGVTPLPLPPVPVLVGPPTVILKFAGDAQSASAGTTVGVPPSVRILDAGENPIVGAAVTFAVSTGGGSVTGASTTTNANGVATVGSWKVGPAAGPNSLAATAGALSTTFTAAAVVGSATKLLVVQGPPATITVGAAIPPIKVQLADATSNAVAQSGVALTLTGNVSSGAAGAASNDGAAVSAQLPASSFSAAATTDVNGVATFTIPPYAGTTGTATITVTGGGVTPLTLSSVQVLTGAASQIAKFTGDGQTASAGTAVPVPPSVRVTDAGENPVGGVPVNFVVATGGGTLTGGGATTNANGVATVGSWTLGAVAGSNSLTVTSGSLTTTFNATGVVGTGARFVLASPLPSSIRVGESLANTPFSVQLVDAAGNAVAQAGVSVSFTGTVQPAAQSQSVTVATNASGIATFPLPKYEGPVGALTFSASASGYTTFSSPTVSVLTGAAARVRIVTQPSATSISTQPFAQQPVLQVQDVGDNPVSAAGIPVAAKIATGGGTLIGVTTVNTNASGRAIFSDLGITGLVGARTLGFANPSLDSTVSTTVSVNVGPAQNLVITAGAGQTAAVNSNVPIGPAVRVTDAYGNSVPNVSIEFAPRNGSRVNGSATPVTLTTPGNDAPVSVIWALGATAGANADTLDVRATSVAINVVRFVASATAGSATRLSLISAPTTAASGSALTPAPSVRLVDGSGNAVALAGQVITASVASGSPTLSGTLSANTDVNGLATFTNLILTGTAGPSTLAFSSSGVTPVNSPTISVTAGSANRLAFSGGGWTVAGTTASGSPFAPQPVVQITDANGNEVATAGVTVSAVYNSGPTGATVSSNTAITDASGRATFTGLRITGPAGSYTLSFGASDLATLVSNPVSVSAGAATGILLVGGNNQTAVVNSAVAIPPAVQVTDGNGNGVSGVSVLFTASTGSTISSNGIGGSSVPVSTDAGGFARAAWKLGTVAQGYTLAASVPGLNGSPLTFAATATAGTASKLIAVSALPSSITVGASINPPSVVIQVADEHGNPVATPNPIALAVNMNVQPSNTTVTGSASTNSSGQATVPLATYSGATGSAIITVSTTASGISPVISQVIPVQAGAATKLTILTQPSSTAAAGSPFAQQPRIQVSDAGGNPVTSGAAGIPINAAIQSGNGTLTGTRPITTDASGVGTFADLAISGLAGQYTLAFTGGSLTAVGSAPINIGASSTSTLAINSGNGQSATVGTAVQTAPSVRVTDAFGNPFANVPITFTVTTAGATITDGSGSGTSRTINTNTSGVATLAAWTLGTAAQQYNLTASSPAVSNGSPVNFAATATAGSAAKLVGTSPLPSSITVGAAINPPGYTIQVADQYGNPVATPNPISLTANFNVQPSNNTITGSVNTNAGGQATFPLTPYNGPAGTAIITVSSAVAGITSVVSPPIPVQAGAASKFVIVTQPPQNATSGNAFSTQPAVQVTDASGNSTATSGLQVTAVTASGSGTFTGNSATTDGSGRAVFSTLALSGPPGSYTIRFEGGGFTSVASSPIALASATTALSVNAGTGQAATVNTPVAVPPSVKVTDGGGNPVAGVPVTFTVGGTGGQISNGVSGGTAPLTINTNGSGIAALSSWTLGTTAQTYALSATATVTSGSPVNFTATASSGVGTQLAFSTAPPGTATNGAPLNPQPVLTLRDQYGNLATSSTATVTAAIDLSNNAPNRADLNPGNGPSNNSTPFIGATLTNASASSVNGVVTFSGLAINGDPGSYTLRFEAPGYSPPNASQITLSSAAASKLVVTLQPSSTAQSGIALATQPVVQLADASNAPVATAGVTVNVFVQSGGGRVNGPLSAVTDGSGRATFSGLSLGSPGSKTLGFSSASLDGVTSSSIVVAQSVLSITTQPGATQQSGVALSPQPVIQIRDNSNNAIASAGQSITVRLEGSSGTLNGTTSALTNANGVATFTNLSVTNSNSNTSPPSYRLIFEGEGFSSATSVTFANNPAPVGSITTTVGKHVARLPRVPVNANVIQFTVKDVNNQVASGKSVSFATGPGTRPDCTITSANPATTNTGGVVTVSVATDSMATGCVVTASTSGFTATSLIATYPNSRITHVWFGDAGVAFEEPLNWTRVSDNASASPSAASDIPFIANFTGVGSIPKLSSGKSFASIYLAGATELDLHSFQMAIRDTVYASNARITAGEVIATGTNSWVVGSFSNLTQGVANQCTSAAPTSAVLHNVNVLNAVIINCRVEAQTVVTDILTANAGSFVKVTGDISMNGNANFLGDSLIVTTGGSLHLGGNTRITGKFSGAAGPDYYLYFNNVEFAGYGNFTSAEISIYGNATFGGTGSAGYTFTGGILYLGGNFKQINGGSSPAFRSTGSHYVAMVGAVPQNIEFADPAGSTIKNLFIDNSQGVTALTKLRVQAAPLEDAFGYMNIREGQFIARDSLVINGELYFETGSSMRVDTALTYNSCYKDFENSPFSGEGTINGGTPDSASCYDTSSPAAERRVRMPVARRLLPRTLPIIRQ